MTSFPMPVNTQIGQYDLVSTVTYVFLMNPNANDTEMTSRMRNRSDLNRRRSLTDANSVDEQRFRATLERRLERVSKVALAHFQTHI